MSTSVNAAAALNDVRYALGQLRRVRTSSDCVQRALDALVRAEAELITACVIHASERHAAQRDGFGSTRPEAR